ncbi:MAG: transglycosylase SLT domain-containing protein [SAR324 cluster bacterium]|nr:transglycosylase SLT domain-containing protein [SAR324 cluster bacterium]
MPVAQLKFVIISAALLLGCSPLWANEDKLGDRETPAIQDWMREDGGDGDRPAFSGVESGQPEGPDDSQGDADTGGAAGRDTVRNPVRNPVRNRPASAIKTPRAITTPGLAARDEDGTPAPGPKLSRTSARKDGEAATGEKAPGASVKRGAAEKTGTVATNPAEAPGEKPDFQHGPPKVAAGQDGRERELADGVGDTAAGRSRGPSGAEKRIAEGGGEAEQSVPDHRETEISRDDSLDRDGKPDRKAGDSRENQPVGKGTLGETAGEKPVAETPKSRPWEFYGNIGSTGDEVFPSSPGIDRQKEFWILIFTRYSTQQGVIHDGRIATPIFQELNLKGMGPRTQARYIKHSKRRLGLELKKLAEALRKGSKLTDGQLALKSRMHKGVTPQAVVQYAERLHFQRGLSDRFQEGIIRSGALMGMMRRTMARYGLPEDLVYLPHVESSFVNNTLSRSGARGIWQFTRGTGRRYMRVGYLVDQRLDPVVATRSAARFLSRYYKQFKSWPLTISSYNHGPVGIKRIIRTMGTRDLGVMIRDYEGPRFRFASKNFYAEFLAAREIAKNYRRYFGELKMARPMRYASAKLPYYVYARDAARALKISLGRLRWMNPALRRTIWKGINRIPKGYVLRIPVKQNPLQFIAAIPKSARHKRQRVTRVVRVRRGDTLIRIGRRYGIPWRRIALANNIHRGRIRRGQRLLLPFGKRRPARSATAVGRPAKWRKPAGNTVAGNTVAGNTVAGNTMAGKTMAGNTMAGKTVAGKTALPSRPLGKSNPVIFSDDAGRGVSSPSAKRRMAKTGTDPATTVSIGRKHGGGNTAAGTHDLAMVDFDSKTNTGRIVAVFGESLGHYAEWGNISARRLRRLNGFSFRRKLRNGEYLLIYLNGVTPDSFTQRRVKFHRNLETTFFAANSITQRRRVEVKRGQSPWKLARKNNVPLWLFFRENPGLLNNPMLIGMEVIVPVVEAVPSR